MSSDSSPAPAGKAARIGLWLGPLWLLITLLALPLMKLM